MLSLKQFEDREAGLYKNARKARLEHLVKAVAIKHGRVGFNYPTSPIIEGIPPFLVTPRVKYGLPTDVTLSTNEIYQSFTKVIYSANETAIYVNFDALEDIGAGIDLFQGKLDEDPEFHKKFSGVGVALNALPDIRQMFRPTTSSELESLISKALGEYLLEVTIKKHPESWLCSNDPSSESDFTRQMVRNGITSHFEIMFLPCVETISESVWGRDSGDKDLSRKKDALRSWYTQKAGRGLVSPLLDAFSDRALEYLVVNKLSVTDDYLLHEIPRYRERAFIELKN